MKVIQLKEKPIRQNNLYKLVRIKVNGQLKFAKIFYIDAIQDQSIKNSIEMSLDILNSQNQKIYPQHFLHAKRLEIDQKSYLIFTDPYQTSLQEYINKKVIQQEEALDIIKQVVKCIYSIYQIKRWHRNLRPCHFVKVNNIWKIQSFVFGAPIKQNNQIKNQYSWDRQYQPPEVYKKLQFTIKQLDQMIVWNIGSIMLDILIGRHKFNSLQSMHYLKDKKFSFKTIGIKKKFSYKIQQLLNKMLSYNPRERMSYSNMISNQLISQQISFILSKYNLSYTSEPSKMYIKSCGKHKKSIPGIDQVQHQYNQLIRKQNKSNNSKKTNVQNSMQNSSIYNNQQISHQYFSINLRKKLYIQQAVISPQFDLIQSFEKFQVQINKTFKKQSHKIQKKQKYYERKQTPSLIQIVRVNTLQSQFSHSISDYNILKRYKMHYDQLIFLKNVAQKLKRLTQISYQQKLFCKLALSFISLMNFSKYVNSLVNNINIFNLPQNSWLNFKNSDQFIGLRLLFSQKLSQNIEQHNKTKQQTKIIKMKYKQKQILQAVQIFLNKQFSKIQYNQVKKYYRLLLLTVYNKISKKYKQFLQDKYARIAVYLVLSYGLQKFTSCQNIKKCFQVIFKQKKLQPTFTIPYDQVTKFIEESNPNILVKYATNLLQQFFQIKKQ